jgi:hypothetical protein
MSSKLILHSSCLLMLFNVLSIQIQYFKADRTIYRQHTTQSEVTISDKKVRGITNREIA